MMRAPTSVAEFLLDAVQVHMARVWNGTELKCALKSARELTNQTDLSYDFNVELHTCHLTATVRL